VGEKRELTGGVHTSAIGEREGDEAGRHNPVTPQPFRSPLTPRHFRPGGRYSWHLTRIIVLAHRSTILFSTHFCPHSCAPGKTSRLVTHSKIVSGQACLTKEFFAVGLLEKRYTLVI
jgi:hypothetical protein